jgi:hypothetical protein
VDLGRGRDHAVPVFTVLIAPVYIVPIFNKVTRLERSEDCRTDPESGASERDPGEGCVHDGCVAADDADERQRERLRKYDAHHAE